MKHLIIPSLALCALVAPALQAAEWGTNIPEALKQAAAEDKITLVVFTGSDWCPPCIALKKNVLSTEEFEDFADENLVLVELDFPRKKQLAATQKQHNDSYAKQFQIQGFPTVLLLDDNGAVISKTVGGASSTDDLLEALGFEGEDADEASETDEVVEDAIDQLESIIEELDALGEDHVAVCQYVGKKLEDDDIAEEIEITLHSYRVNALLNIVSTKDEAKMLRDGIVNHLVPTYQESFPEVTEAYQELADILDDEAEVEALIRENAENAKK